MFADTLKKNDAVSKKTIPKTPPAAIAFSLPCGSRVWLAVAATILIPGIIIRSTAIIFRVMFIRSLADVSICNKYRWAPAANPRRKTHSIASPSAERSALISSRFWEGHRYKHPVRQQVAQNGTTVLATDKMLPRHIPIINKGAFQGTITFLLLTNIANSFIRIPPAPIYFSYLCTATCGCVEIGRQPRLRIWCLTAWGFESPHPHERQPLVVFCTLFRFTHWGPNPPDPLSRYAPKCGPAKTRPPPGA